MDLFYRRCVLSRVTPNVCPHIEVGEKGIEVE